MANSSFSSPNSSPTAPTNTLTITNLENHHFEETPLLSLRAQTETFGTICFFSPIKSFHRVFVVYESVFDAQRAKALLHCTRFEGTTIRVYFGQHTELSINPERHYLHLPEQQVNSAPEQITGLISPPGSPPVGYVADEDMVETVEEFSLDESSSATPELSLSSLTLDTPTESKQHQQILKLRINTIITTSPWSAPRSPITPTRLAFSPAKGLQDEQPFITIQDWGVNDAASTTQCY
ncbi:hypothetical protein BGZ58_010893 [Dissophora ornata]|nr:hypothetical protein BGZ58_010893 [Dissophora ornata]